MDDRAIPRPRFVDTVPQIMVGNCPLSGHVIQWTTVLPTGLCLAGKGFLKDNPRP